MNQQTNSDHVAGIKERLRTFPLFFLNGSRWMQSTQIEPICLDAADYIEQLEKALQFYADGKHVNDGIGWDSQPTIEDGEVARAALTKLKSGINPKS